MLRLWLGPRPAARLAVLAGLVGFWHDAAAQGASRGPGGPDESPTAITAAMIALGDSIFHGKAGGGACFMCHGADAKGTPGIAPDLTDGKWLHGDGSYAAILRTVENGVPDPKENPDPMPPMGGARLTPAQVRAVAAYVYALSHPEVRGRPQ
jgi:mono/diheme cytochrome c family protein